VPPSRAAYLLTCQRLWAAFLGGIVAIAAIVTLVAETTSALPAALPAGLAAAAGAGAIVGVLAIERVFAATPPADDEAALGEYRMRLVLQAVTAETAVLVAVVLTFVFGPAWVAAVGGAAAALALLLVRPSAERFRRLDAAWSAAGADVSLQRGAGLTPGTPPGPDADRSTGGEGTDPGY
jgi:hypothetical protein